MVSSRKRRKRKPSNVQTLSQAASSSPREKEESTNQSLHASNRVSRRYVLSICAVIAALTLLSYHNSLYAPFVFDDLEAIVENPSIRDLSKIGTVLSPPLSSTGAVGRPIVNLSFAINHALSGTDVFGYHVGNLLIHLFAALALFGVVRRTLLQYDSSPSNRIKVLTIAGFVSILWAVHPLVTESVTSVVQRSESLMGLFFLLTFYSFIRANDAQNQTPWRVATVVFCYFGVATKEVMVVCPLLLMIYDRTFFTNTFLHAWRANRVLYIALLSSWGLLFYLVVGTRGRNETVGYGYGIAWWEYALTQCYGVANYIVLTVWPTNLVFDYGTEIVTDLKRVVPGAVLLSILFGLTVRALLLRKAVGFAGAWFFCILAPSSSILPLTTQTLAEHRMYLPLISVVLLAVLLLFRLKRLGILIATLLVPLLIFGTIRRNEDYQNAIRLWTDTVEKMPGNARAHNDLANALNDEKNYEKALKHYQHAISLNPNSAKTYFNMAETLHSIGRTSEAIPAYEAALLRDPHYAKAHNNLGNLLIETGTMEAAAVHFEKAAELAPQHIDSLMNAGNGLMAIGQWSNAQQYFKRVLEIDPSHVDATNNLGAAMVRTGNIDEAIIFFRESISRHPRVASLHYNMGKILAQSGEFESAVSTYRRALQIEPNYPEAYFNMGNILLRQKRYEKAIKAYGAALSLKPDYVAAINNLGGAYKRNGDLEKARTQYQRVLRLQPNHLRAQKSLAELLKKEESEK